MRDIPPGCIPTSFTASTLSMPVIKRYKGVIFIRLPKELWRSCGVCQCPHCLGMEGWWDTLAITKDEPTGNDFTYVVHMPDPYDGIYDSDSETPARL